VKGNQLEDREIEEWARLILEEANLLVELLGEAEDSRHLIRDNSHSGILVDQWTQPPLFNTDDIATDDRRLEMRAEVQITRAETKASIRAGSGNAEGPRASAGKVEG
jgi:hypothetical protein